MIIHWMETLPLALVQVLVVKDYDFVFCIVHYREKVDHSFFASQKFVEGVSLCGSEVVWLDSNAPCDGLKIYCLIDLGAYEPCLFLILLIPHV